MLLDVDQMTGGELAATGSADAEAEAEASNVSRHNPAGGRHCIDNPSCPLVLTSTLLVVDGTDGP